MFEVMKEVFRLGYKFGIYPEHPRGLIMTRNTRVVSEPVSRRRRICCPDIQRCLHQGNDAGCCIPLKRLVPVIKLFRHCSCVIYHRLIFLFNCLSLINWPELKTIKTPSYEINLIPFTGIAAIQRINC
jgi:hypothetical protein